jgi:Putative glutamine amidotransferase
MHVLLCGESGSTHSVHVKGVSSFSTSSCVEGADQLRAVPAQAGLEVDRLPGHLVPARFPGRGAVFTSDRAPHWAQPEFLAWPGRSSPPGPAPGPVPFAPAAPPAPAASESPSIARPEHDRRKQMCHLIRRNFR